MNSCERAAVSQSRTSHANPVEVRRVDTFKGDNTSMGCETVLRVIHDAVETERHRIDLDTCDDLHPMAVHTDGVFLKMR